MTNGECLIYILLQPPQGHIASSFIRSVMEPWFFGESECSDWTSLGVAVDFGFRSPASAVDTDNYSASEMQSEMPICCASESGSIFPLPATHETSTRLASLNEHVGSYIADVQLVFDRELLDRNQPL